MSWDLIRDIGYGVAPTLGVLAVFLLVMRAILRADAGERRAAAKYRGSAPARSENTDSSVVDPDAGSRHGQ